ATNITITGRGWGHGIGMSQYGTYGYATHTDLTYKQILQRYYTGISFGDAGNPPIRVMLNASLSSVSVTATTPFKATDGKVTRSVAGGVVAKVTWVGGTTPYKLVAGSATYRFAAPVVFKKGSSFLKLVNANQNGSAGVHYRGQLRVVHFTGGLMVVNRLPLQSYLYGVVPFESPASWPATALRVQAVAARSYALATRKTGAFDVYCTTASQYYGGIDAGHGEEPSTTRAVDDTAGVVATYGGAPIVAYYFSTSGGHTENIENVWSSAAPRPYLKGVSDPYDGASPYHIWKPSTVSAGWVAGRLGTYSPGNPSGVDGLLRTVYVTKRGTSPRVMTAYVVGDSGIHAISGAGLRARLGLRDTWVGFRSMSISPSKGTKKIVTFGSGTTINGRTYPALAKDAKVTLHYYRSGAWHTMSLATARGGIRLPDGSTARYSAYSLAAKPPRTTRYYFSWGSSGARTPETTISVRPLVTVSASKTAVAPGGEVTLTGTAKPALAGKSVYLQQRNGDTWTDVANVKLNEASSYTFTWTAPATAGEVRLRVRIPATTGLLGASSQVVVVTVG
ncbi:MAG TPA: SpoIID/LytB domain-containing protein, partial [Thermoleophilia bacterium]|nr:SpoIID/LytB domain-containing protein [Thermoleophilia bacterium]